MWSISSYKKSIENGIDVVRIFDALNDTRNMKRAMEATKRFGGHCEAAISYTTSPVHTREYFVKLAKELERDGRGHDLHQGYGQPASALRSVRTRQVR